MSNETENSNHEDGGIRLQVYLSHSGLASRRNSVQIIESGRVRVNEKTVRERGFRVFPGDEVKLDGERLSQPTKKIYLLLNKPGGTVCSNEDPEGRPLVVDLLSSYHDLRLFTVGRLDFLTTGAIFVTNDGTFSQMVSHPRYGVEKEYLLEARHEIPDEFLVEFQRGIWVEGECFKIKQWKRISPREAQLVLVEGKNREIRSACMARRVTVKSLERLRIGCVELGNLQTGKWRELRPSEIDWFMHHAEAQTQKASGRREAYYRQKLAGNKNGRRD